MNTPPRIALIRHPAPLIAPGICYGRLDVALAPHGIAAIPAIARQLAEFTPHKIWTSPSRRCRTLADALANATPPQTDARLQELNFGDWEGKPWETVSRHALDCWAANLLSFAPPGGETGAELIARVKSFHADLLAEQQDCVVVSHGGPLKVLASLLRGQPVDLLAPTPAWGTVEILTAQAASDDSTRHSTTISVAPSTSPE